MSRNIKNHRRTFDDSNELYHNSKRLKMTNSNTDDNESNNNDPKCLHSTHILFDDNGLPKSIKKNHIPVIKTETFKNYNRHYRYHNINPPNRNNPNRNNPNRNPPNRNPPNKDPPNKTPPNKNDGVRFDDLLLLNLLFNPGFGPKKITNNDNNNNNKNPPAPPKLECKNPLCNHLSIEEDPTPPSTIDVETIKTIDDLIKLGRAFHCKKQTVYKGINLRLMNNLVVPLTELNDMIGLGSVKDHMVDQILFFLQGFNTAEKCNKCADCIYGLPCVQNKTEMLHTVITGPPGVGKTCLARIIGKVYNAMGILSKGDFHEVARSDLIAKYLGQTAIKTQEAIDKCVGGVMFIDEAYSLGHKDKRDSFAKECLDTLNKNLSEKKDFLCIIAGYKKELEECFFSMNDGLTRRFSFRYDISEYDYNELLSIFKLKVKNENWQIDLNVENDKSDINRDRDRDPINKYTDESLINLFRKNREMFPYSGGDVETLFLKCKISHSRRLPNEDKRKILSMKDIEEGIKIFIKDRKYDETKSKNKNGSNGRTVSMYTV